MAVRQATGARTGEQFLDGLRQGGREIWLNGEMISHPLDHPELQAAALSMARVFDIQHEHAGEMLAPSPDDPDRLVNVTHLIPRTIEDLTRRRRAIELVAAISGGTMGRTPDYLNVTFACFAGRSDVWARRDNEQLAANLVEYQKHMRDNDLSTTHALINPQVDRSKPEAEQAMGQVSLHKVGETADAIVVRGARMLATLAPFADELLIYPGSDIRPQDGRYALSFAVPIATPGLRFVCRDSYSRQRDHFDYPLSSRFDEMDAVVIFDDVEIPKHRVFLDGDTIGYSEVITDTGWRGHIMHQAFTRAYVKLCFALGLGHAIANTTGVVRFDHIQEKLGQIWAMSELARSALVAAEAGAQLDDGGVMYPDDRPFLALRGEMPKWLPRCNELLQLDRRGRLHGHAIEGRHRRAAARPDRAVLPGRGSRRRTPDPSVPPGLGFPRLRARWPRRTVRALLPVRLLADDRPGLQDRRQVVPRVAGRAVPARLTPTVLITGGGTGIGAAVARRMAADGWNVCVAGRRPEPLAEVAADTGGVAVAGDVSSPAGARHVIEQCLDRFGGLDALVISSGTGATGAVLDQTLERWNSRAPDQPHRRVSALPGGAWSRSSPVAERSSPSPRSPACAPIPSRRRTARPRPG